MELLSRKQSGKLCFLLSTWCIEMNTMEIPKTKFTVRVWPNNTAEAIPVKIVATVDEYFFRIVSTESKRKSNKAFGYKLQYNTNNSWAMKQNTFPSYTYYQQQLGYVYSGYSQYLVAYLPANRTGRPCSRYISIVLNMPAIHGKKMQAFFFFF